MAVKISGVLKDGTGKPVQNCTIQLKAKRNSTTVVVNTLASENPDEAGRYSMDVEYGQYSVILLVEGFPPSHAGTITVYEDSQPGTLNDFLGAMTEDDVRPEALRRFEQMVEEVSRNASAVAQNTAAAKKSATDASASASEAETHATDAAGSARAASTSAGQAASSAQSASSSAGTAATKASEASKSAAAAESSKSAAATSASAAKTSETNAAASQKSAATSASVATTKASEAATSARDAAASKEAAKSSETNASSSASRAASSATAAGNSAKAAKTSETNAKSSETAAEQSASAAAGSKTAAASSASAASTSAGQASASATAAGKSAENALSSATTATAKATEATSQATAAKNSASAAKTSETNAKTSEDNAASSKAAAASSASSAASSASSASASKDEATRQASAAKGSATTASTKATEAAGSATAASQSKTAAESAATRAEAAADRAEEIAGAVAMEDASLTTKGVVKLSNATNSTSESLAATPKAVKAAYDNADKRLQKDQNGKDIPDKGAFLNNINAVSKTDFAAKHGMRYVRVNAPAGATPGKYYPVVVMRSAGSVSELASRVIITTATRTANDPLNNCEFNGFVMPGGWTDRGRYAYGMFWQYQNNERAIHSIMMSNKGDDLRSVFYVDGAAFPVFAFIEDGLSISAPGADLVVNDTTYKFGAINPATECVAADVILDFKSGRGFYESHSLIVNDNLSCKKLFATDEIVARGGNQIRMIGGEYGALWRNDGAKTYLLLTNQGDVYGGWNTLRPFAIDNATGELVIGTKLSASLNGNALTATKLQTARTINGVSFDGTANISLSPADIGCPASPTGWLGTGSNGASITTAQLVTILQNNGAFNTKAWVARCAWAYADSASIPDSETGCGIIPLAGAVIEVFSHSATHYTIRITTATMTSVSDALTNAEFIYVFNGTAYSPGWRRALNTKKLPTPLEIGAYSISEVNQMTRNFVTSTKLESGSLDAGFQTLSCYSLQIFDVQTTTDSPNMFVSPIAGYNMVFRSTSSRRYKTDIESLENRYADELLKLRPVWYRSTCERDRKDWGHYGLIAEEVGEIAPQYVHWRPLTDEDDPGIASDNGMVAEGVMYDRLVVPLIHHIQKLTKRVEELEARLKLSEL
ncbi:prophage tail fiber N-terminal domain-containing protein [Escherichia albertii]|uniref:prophage tail fiber N-terminal domain-containing protein n=3 Tax=Escherichia albertii TaxID=208962 RepID=UPI000BAA9E3D|nr:prophage tail fiber N-terminal domain-containing protein [Escherichia albertii]EEW4356796.1 short-chain fatty acid transporter [Escherichia albertii]EEW7553401.1 short-chain fatty acid transporter [Escherichia albertii]MCU7277208.1 prophage tail fiber N-terminal domain-containing protein [Escherichia albertii]